MFLLPFHVVGCSHETSAADLVGSVRLSPERMEQLLQQLRARAIDAVAVSTCHRTELYWWGDADLAPWFKAEVLGHAHRDADRHMAGSVASPITLDRRDADLAVRHLFAVAAGMRSARYGEPEILGQVREAWRVARRVGTSRGEIDSVFRRAIDAARHIRIAMGGDADPSLGQRVRERLDAFVSTLAATGAGAVAGANASANASANAPENPPAGSPAYSLLIVGSGDAARGVLKALQYHPMPQVSVRITNRTESRARAVATVYGVETVPWEARHEAIAQADMVVYAIQATAPLVTLAEMEAIAAAGTPRLWVDLGVPGAVADDALAASKTGTFTVDAFVRIIPLDELHERRVPAVAESRERKADAALQRELDRFARTTHRMQLGERLGALEARAMAVAVQHRDAPADELARRVTRLVLRELTRG